MKTIAIITSRWHSTRLPGKALADIGGKPMLQHVVDQARQAKLLDEVVVATSVNSQPIIDYCQQNNIPYYAGSEDDILDRLYQTAKEFKADVIVRLWGDCPLIEPSDIDFTIEHFKPWAYFTYTTARGVVAIVSLAIIAHAWLTLESTTDREWIHRYLSGCWKTLEIKETTAPFSVDTQEDLDRAREIYERNQTNS